MTNPKNSPTDPDEAIRERILSRAKGLTTEIAERVGIALSDLDAGRHRAALGALDGIERQLTIIRSVLLLLEQD
jgi:hypothetical protein